MVASVVLGMLCVHLLCFCVMFFLINTRLHGKRMGMEVFALGNLLLGSAYILQLVDGPTEWNMLGMINHTLTLCAPLAYVLGAFRFFNRPTPVTLPLLGLALSYSVLQYAVYTTLGAEARHAMLSGSCTLLFAAMATFAIYGARSYAKDLHTEMLVIGSLIAILSALNAGKLVLILTGGLETLDMGTPFQTVFYLYMSFLGTVLPPALVWLVLRRLTDELRGMASRDPLTRLLNRRGMMDAIERHFRTRETASAHLLMMDIDHFKRINDTHGHQAGDTVLCHIAQSLQQETRQGDLICRLGGEEFIVVCLDCEHSHALRIAQRICSAIEKTAIPCDAPALEIQCTVTIGLSATLYDVDSFDRHMQQADAALYRGKNSGRNRVETSEPQPPADSPPPHPAMHPAAALESVSHP